VTATPAPLSKRSITAAIALLAVIAAAGIAASAVFPIMVEVHNVVFAIGGSLLILCVGIAVAFSVGVAIVRGGQKR
jgi:hypothetical protein